MPTPYSEIDAKRSSLSGDADVDSLIVGTSWNSSNGSSTVVTYSFADYGSTWSSLQHFRGGYGGSSTAEPYYGFQPLTETQQEGLRLAFDEISQVANITFVEVDETSSSVGTIRVGKTSALDSYGYTAWAYYPSDYASGGDLWLSNSYFSNNAILPGGSLFETVMHEIGHAVGLAHPFESSGSSTILRHDHDNTQHTIMSYSDHPDLVIPSTTPMLLDIAALQHLYGAQTGIGSGDDVHSLSGSIHEALWDPSGFDTLDLSSQTIGAKIDLTPGSFSSVGPNLLGQAAENNFAIADGAWVEAVIGGQGSDTILGNDQSNSLYGRAGNDLIIDSSGSDFLQGNAGIDHIISLGEGGDTLRGGRDMDILDAARSSGSDHIFGDLGDDILLFGLGDDLASGGEGADRFLLTAFEGNITISDFEVGLDLLAIQDHSEEQVEAAFHQEGANMVYESDGNRLVLLDAANDGELSQSIYGYEDIGWP